MRITSGIATIAEYGASIKVNSFTTIRSRSTTTIVSIEPPLISVHTSTVGMVNVPRIKGSHNAVKSGMLAAEAAFEALAGGKTGGKRRRRDAGPSYLCRCNRGA